ncbi:MAG: 50S ribosomal protein L15 [Ruminococcaceae bacterium]|nr:50S ribosomal protein L15 [Oscillospiraceae bacterium]MBQ8899230.1 50S ribosomal protein L15 [Clostridia bacterium]
MKLNELSPAAGSVRPNYRKGRGIGSGNGKTAGKGHKGQNARSGGGVRPGFEGGQMPISRRLPMKGFNNKNFTTVYAIVNVSDLNCFEEGTVVTVEELISMGLVKKTYDGVKILGNGELTKKLTVRASAFSASAEEKIKALGGNAEVI